MNDKTLYIMVGVPGSGKSYFAKNHMVKGAGWYYVSRDAVRYSIIKEEDGYFSHEKEVFMEFIKLITMGLRNPDIHYVIADATHLHWASRHKLLKALSIAGNDLNVIDIIPVMIDPDIKTAIERNDKRFGREKVDSAIIKHMYSSMTDPITDEFKYTAIMYVRDKPEEESVKPRRFYQKNEVRMKEVPIKSVIGERTRLV